VGAWERGKRHTAGRETAVKINTHKDLDVWKDAMAAAMAIFGLTKGLPPEER